MVTLKRDFQKIELDIDSDLTILGETVNKIACLIKKDKQEEEIDYFIINEMIANAIVHGNQLDKQKKVHIEVFINETLYRIVITDQGDGFDWRKQMGKGVDLEGDSDRGRGIAMTRMMSDHLGYNEKGNVVTIINWNR